MVLEIGNILSNQTGFNKIAEINEKVRFVVSFFLTSID
jgi:hypothetical protein